MRLSLVLLTIAGISTSVHGQTIPNCALTCLADAPAGNCLRTDNSCLCRDQDFLNNATACIVATCQGADFAAAEQAADAICAAVGVTLTYNPTASGSSAAPTASSTHPASSGAASSAAAASASATHKSGAVVKGANGLGGAVALGMAALAMSGMLFAF